MNFCSVSATHVKIPMLSVLRPALIPGFCPDEFTDPLLKRPSRGRPQLQPAI